MKITTQPPHSLSGVPAIVDADGRVMTYADGIRAIRRHMEWSVDEMGAAVGVSGRAVEGWEQGRRTPSTPALLLLRSVIESR